MKGCNFHVTQLFSTQDETLTGKFRSVVTCLPLVYLMKFLYDYALRGGK